MTGSAFIGMIDKTLARMIDEMLLRTGQFEFPPGEGA
jgi:hypothetical protein